MRILFLSSVPALDTSAGAVVMRRHLDRLDPARYQILHAYAEPSPDPAVVVIGRSPWHRRLAATRFHFHLFQLDQGLAMGRDLRDLEHARDSFQPDLVLTVAEPPLHLVARRFARRHRLPLVAIFHDWVPVWFAPYPITRRLVAWQLRATHRAARISLCVTSELRAMLGSRHPDARILPPIPSATPVTAPHTPHPASPPLLVYCGRADGIYSPLLDDLTAFLLNASEQAPARLRILGGTPAWPSERVAAAKAAGYLAGFLPPAAFAAELAAADVLLVCCPFSTWAEPIARASFPSKLVEYCRYGRPILLWAPPHAAAATWARRTDAAELVTSPDSAALTLAISRLLAQPERLATLAARALAVAHGEFDPERIHADFERALEDALLPPPARK